jgi:hypothetical protein
MQIRSRVSQQPRGNGICMLLYLRSEAYATQSLNLTCCCVYREVTAVGEIRKRDCNSAVMTLTLPTDQGESCEIFRLESA